MMSAEFFKIRYQRHPLVAAIALVVGVSIPSLVLIWYTPSNPAIYTDAYRGAFGVVSILVAIEFGGWLLGAEYRHGTVKRLLTAEPRRLVAFGAKGLVGAIALSAALAVGSTIGWIAARIVGSANGVTVPWQGRDLLGDGLTALIAATVAYSLSAITRSDSFAKVGTLAMMLVLEPALAVVPDVGDYTIGSALYSLTGWIAGHGNPADAALSTLAAAATLATWLVAFAGAGAALFATRDL